MLASPVNWPGPWTTIIVSTAPDGRTISICPAVDDEERHDLVARLDEHFARRGSRGPTVRAQCARSAPASAWGRRARRAPAGLGAPTWGQASSTGPSYNRTGLLIDDARLCDRLRLLFRGQMAQNEKRFPGGLRVAALLVLLAGAAGSVAFMLRAGQRTPTALLVVMIAWVLAPLAALAWARPCPVDGRFRSDGRSVPWRSRSQPPRLRSMAMCSTSRHRGRRTRSDS